MVDGTQCMEVDHAITLAISVEMALGHDLRGVAGLRARVEDSRLHAYRRAHRRRQPYIVMSEKSVTVCWKPPAT